MSRSDAPEDFSIWSWPDDRKRCANHALEGIVITRQPGAARTAWSRTAAWSAILDTLIGMSGFDEQRRFAPRHGEDATGQPAQGQG